MENELVSIIIPIYNVERFVVTCLESVINQTYTNLEIICVDDCSDDESYKICKEYSARDDRIRIIRHDKNQGLSSARNTGFAASNGAYIAFIDSDDWVDKNYILNLLHCLKESNADVSLCKYVRSYVEGVQLEREFQPKTKTMSGDEALDKLLAVGLLHPDVMYCVAWNKLYKREIINGIEFPVGLKYEDQYFAVKLYKRARVVAELSEKLYYYRANYAGITMSGYKLSNLDPLNIYENLMIEFNKDTKLRKTLVSKIIPLSMHHYWMGRRVQMIDVRKKAYKYTRKYCLYYMFDKSISIKNKCQVFFFLVFPECASQLEFKLIK